MAKSKSTAPKPYILETIGKIISMDLPGSLESAPDYQFWEQQ